LIGHDPVAVSAKKAEEEAKAQAEKDAAETKKKKEEGK
jgi:hypothetical protein